MPIKERLTIGVLIFLIVMILFISFLIPTKNNLCEQVCLEFLGCKEYSITKGKWYTQTEIQCNDDSNLVVIQEKKK